MQPATSLDLKAEVVLANPNLKHFSLVKPIFSPNNDVLGPRATGVAKAKTKMRLC